MADWTLPINTTVYTTVLAALKDRDLDGAFMFDPAVVTPTGLVDNTIRWNSANSKFEKRVAASWVDLDTDYDINVLSLGGLAASAFLQLNPAGDQTIIAGKLILDINSGPVLDFKGGTADHVYMQFYADAGDQVTRSGYFGYFVAGNTDLSIVNEMAGGGITINAGVTVSGDFTVTDFNIDINAITTAQVSLVANAALTSGRVLDITSNLSAKTGNVVKILQDHASSDAIALHLKQDGNNYGLEIDSAAFNAHINLKGTGGGLQLLGGIRMGERAAKAFSTIASMGELWVRNGTVQALMFTDDAGVEINLTEVKTKVLQITNWNMTSTPIKNVAHGLTQSTIRGVHVLLENDPGTFLVEFIGGYSTNLSGGITVGSTNISLTRGTGSDFNNSTDYDGTGDRGWITITYV